MTSSNRRKMTSATVEKEQRYNFKLRENKISPKEKITKKQEFDDNKKIYLGEGLFKSGKIFLSKFKLKVLEYMVFTKRVPIFLFELISKILKFILWCEFILVFRNNTFVFSNTINLSVSTNYCIINIK